MTGSLLDYADRVWRGEEGLARYRDGAFTSEGLHEVAEDVAVLPAFGNVIAIRGGDQLMLFDTGLDRLAPALHAAVRDWTDLPLRWAVYSHGHIDHVFGVGPFDAEAQRRGWPRPAVVAHEGVVDRFDRYRLTAGYNEVINQRQFRSAAFRWPREYRYPDLTHRDGMRLTIGDHPVQLFHGRGETDDATYAFLPDQRVLCTGDLFIWVAPNAGNPQKAQRYPREWAQALRHMAGLEAELLLPGHGVPIAGVDRIRTALLDTAEYLDSLVAQALAGINAGAPLDEIARSVAAPEHLTSKPYLRPLYDEPEFVVRNVWRQYAGWYDGNPAHLKPAGQAELGREIADLAGGAGALAERARRAIDDGRPRLACHLVELACHAAPDAEDVQRTRAEIYRQRTEQEHSTMARGVFAWAAAESDSRLSGRDVLDELAGRGEQRWAL